MRKISRALWLTSAFVAVAISAPAQDRYDDRRGRGGLSEEYGFDYRGGDYNDFRARSAEACQEECRRDRRCEAYTYNRRSGICYLKDRVGSLNRNRDTVTGTKRGGSGGGWSGRGGRNGFSEEVGYDYRGGDYDDFRARGVEECQETCGRDRRCAAYTFNRRTGVCYLKDRIGSLERNDATVTGVRGGRPIPYEPGGGRPPYGQGRGLSEEWGYDYRGNDYADFRVRGVNECKQRCRDDRRCAAYTFNQRTDVCYLKDRVGTAQRNRDTVTGVKGY
jgi:hypothetical protein